MKGGWGQTKDGGREWGVSYSHVFLSCRVVYDAARWGLWDDTAKKNPRTNLDLGWRAAAESG